VGRHALLLATTDHVDPTFSRLKAPAADVNALERVLRDPAIGGFETARVELNGSSQHVREAIEGFLHRRSRDDLLVLYFSGHGVLNDRGQLFLATSNTMLERLNSTSVPASFIRDEMDGCRSNRQLLILDCCHSGAFAGAKRALGASVGTEMAFGGTGFGRIVLTATDATQFAFEGDTVLERAQNSLFTHFLIEGLRTGAADLDGDGLITVDELYSFVYEKTLQSSSRQTPGKWTYKQQGDLLVAHAPILPANADAIPRQVEELLKSTDRWARVTGIAALGELIADGRPGLARVARGRLEQLGEDTSDLVSERARSELAKLKGALQHVTPPPPPQAVPTLVTPPPPQAVPTLRAPVYPPPLLALTRELPSLQPTSIVSTLPTDVESDPFGQRTTRRKGPWVIAGAGTLAVSGGVAGFVLAGRSGELEIDVSQSEGGPSVGNVDVYVDDKKQCSVAHCVVADLVPGLHSVKVLAEGFAPATEYKVVETRERVGVLVRLRATVNEPGPTPTPTPSPSPSPSPTTPTPPTPSPKGKSPKLREGATQINGRLPPEVIQRIVRQNFGRFRLCYENGMRSNPNLQGRVAVKFVIDRSGAVSMTADGGSDLPDQSVVQCVVRGFGDLSFPQPEGGAVTVVYPIIFNPGD
jgi:hypothetical protein